MYGCPTRKAVFWVGSDDVVAKEFRRNFCVILQEKIPVILFNNVYEDYKKALMMRKETHGSVGRHAWFGSIAKLNYGSCNICSVPRKYKIINDNEIQ